ncbi:MAG: hypothetical protein ABUT39_20360 [Acidobacteriota bacterium]
MADEAVVIPIVIDLGKTKRKRIKQLKRGRGRLAEETRQALAELRGSLGEAAVAGKELVPVVMIYRKKAKRKKRGVFPFFL